jgi:hypothetical protein
LEEKPMFAQKNQRTFFALATLLIGSFALPAPVRAEVENLSLAVALEGVRALDVINWKVGDTLEYDVSLGSFPIGNSIKSVTKDEGTAIWLRQEVTAMNQKEIVDTLLNKADGRILKMVRNGQEQSIPDNTLEIISQDFTEIRVKAGTFKVIHIVAKTKEIEKIELWANPRDTAIDGTVKQAVTMQLGNIVMELKKYNRMP